MATIFPLSASVGQEFEGYIYDGTIWNLIGNEYNPTVYSAYEPDNPKPGDLWVDSSVDVPTFALNDYLTIESASSTYATKTELDNIDALPSQTGNNGKFLTTDGASASWAIIDLSNYATQQYANNSASAAAAAIVDSAPETLNTLNELAAALNDDSNFATTVTNSLSNKLDISSASSTYLTQVNASNTYQTIVPNISNEEIGYLNNASANIQTQLNSKLDKSIPIVETNANSYTFNINDAGKLILANGGNENVLYIPDSSTVNFPIGTQINIFQSTSPTVIVYVSDAQSTILYPSSGTDLRAQYSAATIIKIKSDTWIIVGDLAP